MPTVDERLTALETFAERAAYARNMIQTRDDFDLARRRLDRRLAEALAWSDELDELLVKLTAELNLFELRINGG